MSNDVIQVLLVEDSAADAYLLRKFLSTEENIELTQVERLNEAIRGLRKIRFDAILLDLSLPDSRGLNTVKQIHAAVPETPILVLTGLDDEEIAIAALREGAQDYLVKGKIQRTWMVRAIQYAIERQQNLDKLQHLNELLEQENADRIRVEKALQVANEQLQRLVIEDSLTGLANRRRLDEYLRQEWSRCRRTHLPLSFILCDIDHFKNYNDYYGHPAGDRCLHQVAQGLKTVVQRPSDLVARYGGEEFAFVLPDTDLVGATKVSQQIKLAIQSLNIPHVRSAVADQITLSIGVVSTQAHQNECIEHIILVADEALYQAKEQGRNRIVTYQDSGGLKS
ncbi:MAG: diguanylate cyclase [Cyanobacteria bacterium J06635_1]